MLSNQDSNELQLVNVRQAAKKLCCSVANVYALIEAGALAVVQVGRSKGYRIDLRDLEAFIQQRKFHFQVPRSVRPATRLKHIKR